MDTKSVDVVQGGVVTDATDGEARRAATIPTDEKERVVQAMFSSIAAVYDLNNTLLSFGLHHAWKRETLRAARLSAGDRVIDIGTGTGDLALAAQAAVGASGVVAAIDLNESMLRVGRKKGAKGSSPIWIRSNAERLPFPDAQFDVALSGFCLRNVTHLNTALAEARRVLRPGGRFVCLEFSRPTATVLRVLYDFYSFTLLPKIGQWVSSDRTGVYNYLPDSIRRFPDQETFCSQIQAAGFTKVTYRNLTGGIVAIHTGCV